MGNNEKMSQFVRERHKNKFKVKNDIYVLLNVVQKYMQIRKQAQVTCDLFIFRYLFLKIILIIIAKWITSTKILYSNTN